MSDFATFVEDCKGLVETLVRGMSGGRDLPAMLHFRGRGHTEGVHVDQAWFATDAPAIENLVVPFIATLRPESVAWTFTGQRGRLDGFWDHHVACVVVVDRERAEVWEARLVRHDQHASLGAWRPWPVDESAGRLITPIQEALR